MNEQEAKAEIRKEFNKKGIELGMLKDGTLTSVHRNIITDMLIEQTRAEAQKEKDDGWTIYCEKRLRKAKKELIAKIEKKLSKYSDLVKYDKNGKASFYDIESMFLRPLKKEVSK